MSPKSQLTDTPKVSGTTNMGSNNAGRPTIREPRKKHKQTPRTQCHTNLEDRKCELFLGADIHKHLTTAIKWVAGVDLGADQN